MALPYFSRRPSDIVIVVLLVILSLLMGAQYLFNHYAERYVDVQLREFLPGLSEKLGVAASYDELKADFVNGIEISNFQMVELNNPSHGGVVVVPRLRFNYELSLSAPFIKLKGVKLKRPQLSFYLNPDLASNEIVDQTQKGTDLVYHLSDELKKMIEKASTSRVSIANHLTIGWEQAKVDIFDKTKKNTDKPLRFRFLLPQGALELSPSSEAVLNTALLLEDNVSHITTSLTLKQSGLDVGLVIDKLDVKDVQNYLGLDEIKGGQVSGRVGFHLDRQGKLVSNFFDLTIKHLSVEHWRLSSQPINDIHFSLVGKLQWDPALKRFQFSDIQLGSADVAFRLEGDVQYNKKPSVDLNIVLEKTELQKFIDFIPHDFIPKLKDAQVEGSLAMNMAFKLHWAKLHQLVFKPEITIADYRLVKAPKEADITKLKKPFKHRAYKKGKFVKEFMVGPQNKRFVSYNRLGQNIIKGVLTCEDGRFFRHHGFRVKHIRQSLIQNLKEKRFARGGSTITMQLAKNLYLGGEKNLSRKFQEMLIAYALEQSLTKKRILEIYMNIIEWGPKLYGIGAASHYYFARSPAKLNPLQAAYLGSIIPNPVKYHYMFKRGEVSDRWSRYLGVILRKMKVDDGEYYSYQGYKPVFGWVAKQNETYFDLEL